MKVYIVHGYTASPDDHWFPWLETMLARQGIECIRLSMPNSDKPSPDSWLSYLNEQVQIDEKTVVVGHSLGCIAWLNFLSRNYLQPAGAVFVSGFYQPIERLSELTSFSNLYAVSPALLDFKSYVIAALDDDIVPHQYSDDLAKHLKSTYIRFNEGGHFLEREGWTEFPLILTLILSLLKG